MSSIAARLPRRSAKRLQQRHAEESVTTPEQAVPSVLPADAPVSNDAPVAEPSESLHSTAYNATAVACSMTVLAALWIAYWYTGMNAVIMQTLALLNCIALFAYLLIVNAEQDLSCGVLFTSVCAMLVSFAFLPLLVFE